MHGASSSRSGDGITGIDHQRMALDAETARHRRTVIVGCRIAGVFATPIRRSTTPELKGVLWMLPLSAAPAAIVFFIVQETLHRSNYEPTYKARLFWPA
jgi:hypothetical protein